MAQAMTTRCFHRECCRVTMAQRLALGQSQAASIRASSRRNRRAANKTFERAGWWRIGEITPPQKVRISLPSVEPAYFATAVVTKDGVTVKSHNRTEDAFVCRARRNCSCNQNAPNSASISDCKRVVVIINIVRRLWIRNARISSAAPRTARSFSALCVSGIINAASHVNADTSPHPAASLRAHLHE